MNAKTLTTLLLATLFSLNALGGETRVAVAANFTAPMKEIAAAFRKSSGHHINLSFGSSGKLLAQIQNGAPFDIFLSADTAKPAALLKAGQAVAGSDFTYAVGTLVLWSGGSDDARAILDSGHYRKLAIANPRLAPYGAAALQTLEKLGLAGSAKPKLVSGENIAQTYQFVASGNADIGFVALSQIIKNGRAPAGAWVVPAKLHTPIRQDAVLLSRASTNEAAKALIKFLRSDAATAIIRHYGYGISNN